MNPASLISLHQLHPSTPNRFSPLRLSSDAPSTTSVLPHAVKRRRAGRNGCPCMRGLPPPPSQVLHKAALHRAARAPPASQLRTSDTVRVSRSLACSAEHNHSQHPALCSPPGSPCPAPRHPSSPPQRQRAMLRIPIHAAIAAFLSSLQSQIHHPLLHISSPKSTCHTLPSPCLARAACEALPVANRALLERCRISREDRVFPSEKGFSVSRLL